MPGPEEVEHGLAVLGTAVLQGQCEGRGSLNTALTPPSLHNPDPELSSFLPLSSRFLGQRVSEAPKRFFFSAALSSFQTWLAKGSGSFRVRASLHYQHISVEGVTL